jgi:hypothetical protein
MEFSHISEARISLSLYPSDWQMSFAASHLGSSSRQCPCGTRQKLFRFSILWGEGFFFWPVRPQAFLWGRKEVWGGGILWFNLSGLRRRRAPIVERVRFQAGCSWRRRLRVRERSRCRIPPYRLHSKQTRKSDHHSLTRFRLPGLEGRARCWSSLP